MGKFFLKLIRYFMFTLLIVLGVLVVVGVLFIKLSPQFGAAPDQKSQALYEKLPYFSAGKFSNLIPTTLDMDISTSIQMIPKFFKNDPIRIPDFDLPQERRDSLELVIDSIPTRLIWFGHSAFLLQIDGKNILIDPMFGDVPAPNPLFGKNRFSRDLPIEIEELPHIDVVLISHDHYDHLDYGSIQKLKSKTEKFMVPLGVGAHFQRWGVDKEDIQELAWWEETQLESVKFAFTPARHFSGRGLGDRFATLWGSWVIQGMADKVFFSGDSGYGPHFKEIGEKYGPFDFAMMECGQYNVDWKDIHMMPEETAQAGLDVGARVFMPIHWAAFTLAFHSWADPVERVIKKSKELNAPIYIPKIGEFIELSQLPRNQETWWVKP
jgi:L-ascorbate metabolism protein UlaG (beta-lactamase superfamily)